MGLRMSLTLRVPEIPVDLLRTDERASLSWQVSVLGDMVATLDTLTTAGQQPYDQRVAALAGREQRGGRLGAGRPEHGPEDRDSEQCRR